MVSADQAIVNELCRLREEFSQVRLLIKASEDRVTNVYFVTIPEEGGTRSFSIGITKIDLKTGAITNPDGSIEQLSRGLDKTQDKDVMHSISIHSNQDIKFRLDSAGQQTVDSDFLFQLPYVTYTNLEIECTAATEINIFACTNPQATLGNFKVTDMTQQSILGDGVELDTYDSITSLLSNLNRIRYQIKILSGKANWDDVPDTDLASIDTDIDADIATHAALDTGVHGVGASTIVSQTTVDTHISDTSTHGAAEVADVATVSAEIDGDVATHAALPTHIPSGLISMWHGLIANIPTGWVLCDGNNSTPDLRAKFLRGAPAATEAGGTGGADTHTLTENEMPAHTHTTQGYASYDSYPPAGFIAADTTERGSPESNSTGGSAAHNNMPAYYQILFIMKT